MLCVEWLLACLLFGRLQSTTNKAMCLCLHRVLKMYNNWRKHKIDGWQLQKLHRLPNVYMLVFCSWSWLCAFWPHCIIRNQKTWHPKFCNTNIWIQQSKNNLILSMFPLAALLKCKTKHVDTKYQRLPFPKPIKLFLESNRCKFGRNQVIVLSKAFQNLAKNAGIKNIIVN